MTSRRIGKPVDDDEWGMTPQTVNAYYSSAKNEIVFPAAILQPPFFDPQADTAVNYGAIGGVIGHEITHGFDDQGRKSDGKGVLRDWWTPEDAKRFEAQADRARRAVRGVRVPHPAGHEASPPASSWARTSPTSAACCSASMPTGCRCRRQAGAGARRLHRRRSACSSAGRRPGGSMSRDDALRQQIVNDSHSPGFIRAFAPLRNVDAWYEAFDVKPGDALYIAPEQRVRIW